MTEKCNYCTCLIQKQSTCFVCFQTAHLSSCVLTRSNIARACDVYVGKVRNAGCDAGAEGQSEQSLPPSTLQPLQVTLPRRCLVTFDGLWCVCSHECVWRLIRSDKPITYFLLYRLTSLTNKDWLPFVPRRWVFVLVPCCHWGVGKGETQSECEKLRAFLATDQRVAGPSLLPWCLAAGKFWSTPGGGYETERI